MTEQDQPISDILLNWYDANARELPWRVGPHALRRGVQPDPYAVWLSEIMLQQTTVPVGARYFQTFLQRWPTVSDLAAAQDSDVMAAWAGLGYYARARNLLKCARIVAARPGAKFPQTRDELQALPGIGPYTAAAISAIAFGQRETVVDGNVERVVARLFAVRTPLPAAKPELRKLADTLTPETRAGDFAQAMMDLGASICSPRSPSCGICPIMQACRARREGIAADLPARTKRQPKPVRQGVAYVARRHDGAWLLERREDQGLLGGMLGWPGTIWQETAPAPCPPITADWTMLSEAVRHTFTHFHLHLSVAVATVDNKASPDRGAFAGPDFRAADLPSVMRKVFDLARSDPAIETCAGRDTLPAFKERVSE